MSRPFGILKPVDWTIFSMNSHKSSLSLVSMKSESRLSLFIDFTNLDVSEYILLADFLEVCSETKVT